MNIRALGDRLQGFLDAQSSGHDPVGFAEDLFRSDSQPAQVIRRLRRPIQDKPFSGQHHNGPFASIWKCQNIHLEFAHLFLLRLSGSLPTR